MRAIPPAMQAHANPTLNQRIRLPDQSAGTEVGFVGLVVKTESEKSSCSSALRRSTKERTSHFSSRLLLLHHTAFSFPIAQDLHNAAWRCASRSQMGTNYFTYISAWSIMTATAMLGPPEPGAKVRRGHEPCPTADAGERELRVWHNSHTSAQPLATNKIGEPPSPYLPFTDLH
jgi:hypothetical protein